MTAARNGNGYAITSQNYFRALNKETGKSVDPVRKQSISESRGKLKWGAFEYLFGAANLERDGLPSHLLFHGLVSRALDGSSFFTPRTSDLLEHFSSRKTRAEEGETHYPYGLLVTAVNVYTTQPVSACVGDYRLSEREGLRRLIEGFSAGDLSLLDRGLGGVEIYLDFERLGQFFIHRTKTSGERVAAYVRSFLALKRKEQAIRIVVIDSETGEHTPILLRLIRGPNDSDGKPIVFVTNLLNAKKFSRRSILNQYRKRWAVETFYGRMKNLLCLEQFHGRTYNGIMQEIYANLLMLSLAALAVSVVITEDQLNIDEELPSFKNAMETIRRHLFSVIDARIEGKRPEEVIQCVMAEVRFVRYRIRPGRSFPRVSMQPIQSWNLKKSAKLRAHNENRAKRSNLRASA